MHSRDRSEEKKSLEWGAWNGSVECEVELECGGLNAEVWSVKCEVKCVACEIGDVSIVTRSMCGRGVCRSVESKSGD
jgi:hypothetical protein